MTRALVVRIVPVVSVVLALIGVFALMAQEDLPPASEELGYRNAATPPPKGWQGPVFKLSHNYPATNPGPCSPKVCTWLAIGGEDLFEVNLTAPPPQWGGVYDQYIQAILDYVKEGQDPDLDNQKGWKVDVGGKTRWFHVPWMAYDPTRGREFIHGLTNERTATIADFDNDGDIEVVHGLNKLALSATQSTEKAFETWAFGVYNPWGAYAVGGSWGENGEPILGSYAGQTVPAGLPFPEGTAVAKLLFTTATPKDVPYLKGSPVWQADRHVEKDNEYFCDREPQEVRLVQLDVAVPDSRSPTGWVFGTFAYDGNLTGKSVWDRLAPVGLQWGSDPWTFPAVPQSDSIPPRESVLNKKIGIYQHFGCNGRLAGPVDNPQSSCLSCHGGGYAPAAGIAGTSTNTPPIFGFTGLCTNFSAANANYFSDSSFPMAYAGGQYPGLLSMDTSLQMQVAFLQYGQYRQYGRPSPCKGSIGN